MDLILVSNQKLSTKAEPLHRVHSSHANGRRGGWVRRALRAAAIPADQDALRCWTTKPPAGRSRTRASLIGVFLDAKWVDDLGGSAKRRHARGQTVRSLP